MRGVTSSIENPHLGTALDDFLAEDGLESANRTAELRMSVWQEERKSLWQVAQSGYDVFVVQDGGPLVCVTDENASALGVYVKGWDSEQPYLEKRREGEIGDETHREISRTYLNFEPTQPSTLYVVYSAASSPDDWPHELCVNRRYAPPGDTVYVGGFGYLLCLSYGAGHAIRLGGIGDVYRRQGDGHAIRYDGEGQLRDGECYDPIRHHLGRIAHVAEVNPEAPAFDPGHGDVERSSDHAGIALRGGDGPGSIRGDSRQDDRPKRGRRKLRLYHDWPLNKEEREDKELEYCFRTWSASDSSLDYGDLACVSRGERPDRIIRNQKTGKEYGVELTAVYLDDRSVIDHHRMVKSEAKSWFIHDPTKVRAYLHRVAKEVQEKVSKAQGYDNQRDLILAVYLNEPILSQYFTRELQDFIREHQAFRSIDPFVHIVFSLSSMGDGVVYHP